MAAPTNTRIEKMAESETLQVELAGALLAVTLSLKVELRGQSTTSNAAAQCPGICALGFIWEARHHALAAAVARLMNRSAPELFTAANEGQS